MAALVPLTVLWSLTNPLFAAPDESTHLVRAQGFGKWSFTAPFPTDGLPLDAAECFSTEPNTTADCMDLTWGTAGTEVSLPALSNYPPLLHVVAAPATWVGSGEANVYVVRVWLAVVCSVMLAWAGTLLTRQGSGRWPLTGLLIGVTPMVLFTAATVNPSGLTAGLAALGIAGIMAPTLHGEPLRRHWPAVAVAVVGLALTRRDGLVWVALVAAALTPALATGRLNPHRIRQQLANPLVAAGVAAVTAGGLVVAVVLGSRFGSWRRGEGSSVAESVRLVRQFVLDIIGNFGWLDAQLPPETLSVALVVVGFVVLLGVFTGSRRLATSVVALVVALFVSVVLLETQRSLYLQGRYLFVAWIALMVTAAVAAAAGPLPRWVTTRATTVLLGLWAIVHLAGFTHNLRRYAVGQTGPWTFITGEAAWQPPISNVGAVVLFVMALTAAATAVAMVMRPLAAGESPPRHGVATTTLSSDP